MSSPLLRPCILLLLGTACVVPPPQDPSTPVGLEAPVQSPPGEYSARERAQWWEDHLPRLSEADRAEALLCLGELYLELGEPEEARYAFLDARGGRLSAEEEARADRGIGLSYWLDGRPSLGEQRLRDAMDHLEPEAAADVAWLLAASGEGAPNDPARRQRMEPFLSAAGMDARMVARDPRGSHVYYTVARAQWRAASMRGNHEPMTKPWRITVHHSAMPLRGDALALTTGEVRTIQRLHQRDRGWADVGYHFLIDRAGRVVEGRPLDVQGAHAGNSDYNRGNIGICLLGNFVSQPEMGSDYARAQAVSDAQWETLEQLVGDLRKDYGIPASELHTHKDFTGTECPGPALISWVKTYRSQG